jgi:uncharacterized protein (DUF433 family)
MRYNENKTYKVIFGLISMSDLLAKITINSKQCGGRPCIRGMRIRVSDVLDLFVAGLSAEEILEEMPDLEADDLSEIKAMPLPHSLG